jgi:small GTP-binding protein
VSTFASTVRVLGPREAALLAAERNVLGLIREALATLDADEAGVAALRRAAADLDDLFLVVIAGEFNAGKSALLNALLGGAFVDEGVTPTTAQVTLLRYGDRATERTLPDGVLERTLDAPLLREISIVDTPGTNAIIRRHEELTRDFIPRSDLVLFVTSADRPFTESERAFLEHIRAWGKKVLVILNKIDLFGGERQLEEVRAFVSGNIGALLGFTPTVFPVSARLAFQAKAGALPPEERRAAWDASRFEPFERYLVETLDEAARIRLKLMSPLGVADRVVGAELGRARQRLHVLKGDLRGAEAIEGQLDLYRQDMARDFSRRLHEVESVVHELNDRADAFFDETLRLGRVFDLFNADRLRGDFERKVIADSAERIDAAVQSLADWMLDQELRLWRSIAEYVGRREAGQLAASSASSGTAALQADGASASGTALVAAASAVPALPAIQSETWTFAGERRRMLDALGRGADQALSHYDADEEARRWSTSMRDAVAQTALAQVGALSLGTVVVALIGTTAADVTGILAAGVLAGLGLYIIPLRRRQARAQFRTKTDDLRERLKDGMSRQFDTELERSVQRIRDALAPYSRRVRAEHDRLAAGVTQLAGLQQQVAELRARAERELPGATVP